MDQKQLFPILCIVLAVFVSPSVAQFGHSAEYIPGRLGNRPIYWCPSGYGYGAYCPRPTDGNSYTWCCIWPDRGIFRPSCCPFPIPAGMVVMLITAAVVLVLMLVFLTCWCCYLCPLYQKLAYTNQPYDIVDQDKVRHARRIQADKESASLLPSLHREPGIRSRNETKIYDIDTSRNNSPNRRPA